MMFYKFTVAAAAASFLGRVSAQSKPATCNKGLFSPIAGQCLCAPSFVDSATAGPCTAGDPNYLTRPHGDWLFCSSTDTSVFNDCPWLINNVQKCVQTRPNNRDSTIISSQLFNSERSCYQTLSPNSIPAGASSVTIFAAIPSNPPTMSPVKSVAPTASSKPSVSNAPSNKPSVSDMPSSSPSALPSKQPSGSPSARPSNSPSASPSDDPSNSPSAQPSNSPSSSPSKHPSSNPSTSLEPSMAPTGQPSGNPSEAPSSRPSKDCVMPEAGCGWGIWNRYTCQCVCAPNVCSQSTQCDWAGAGCTNTDPYLGCSPGVDCPWIPTIDQQNCVSTAAVPSGVFTVYTNAKLCCKRHYSNVGTCIADSIATLTLVEGERPSCNSTNPVMYYPDIGVGGTNTCVMDNCYEAWMNQDPTYRQYYLFNPASPAACCNLWYPASSHCGTASGTAQPNITVAWFNSLQATCVTSPYAEAPAYMRQPGYPDHYLFTEPNYQKCCATFAPTKNSTACPDLGWRSAANGGPVATGPTPAPSPLPSCSAGVWFKDWDLNSDGINACTNNFLRLPPRSPTFATQAACCLEWNVAGSSCVEVNVCDTTDPTKFNTGFLIEAGLAPAGTNPCSSTTSATVGGIYFHPPSSGATGQTCSNSCSYPGIWNTDVYKEQYLWSTPQGCCAKWFGSTSCTVQYV